MTQTIFGIAKAVIQLWMQKRLGTSKDKSMKNFIPINLKICTKWTTSSENII